MSSHGRLCVCVCVLISSSSEDTTHTAAGLAPMTSLHLNHLFKDNLHTRSHLEALGVRTSTYEFGGSSVPPITVFQKYLLAYLTN